NETPDHSRNAPRVNAERARASAHRHPAVLDRERWIDPDRDLGTDAAALGGEDRTPRFALAFNADRRTGGDSPFEFVVAFTRAGEGHGNSGELGALEALELTFGDDPEAIDIPADKVQQRLVRVCTHRII